MSEQTERARAIALYMTRQACGITPDHRQMSLDNLETANCTNNQTLRTEHFTKSLIHAIHADIESRTLHTRTEGSDWAGMGGNE